jgi:hypothetical protein
MLAGRVRKVKLLLLALGIAATPGAAAAAAPQPLPELDTYLAQLPRDGGSAPGTSSASAKRRAPTASPS